MSVTAPPRAQGPQPQQPQQPHPQQPQQPAPGGGTWDSKLHPRGRGGKWIVSKGAGYGTTGADPTTQQLQQRLQELGFHVPQDGKFGPQTQMAVQAFQARYGLSPSGGVDAATMEVLQNPPDSTLAQVQAAKKAASAGGAKKAATKKKGKAKGSSRKVHRGAQTGSGGPRGASTPGRGQGAAPGAPKGTNTNVQGAGHLGTGDLVAGRGMNTGTGDPAVKNLQAALGAAGVRVNQDGRFGPQTEAAVRRVQQQHGLAADGVVGPETKGLLIGLGTGGAKAAAKTGVTTKAVRRHKVKGQPAVLRTKQPHAAHNSRSAGSRMQLKPPAKAPAKLKYHRDDLPDPDLEETTIAFGVGGQPSRSIKDGRPEGEPLVDLALWTRFQALANLPDEAIADYRSEGDASGDGGTPATLAIPDYRSELAVALTEAIAARKAAAGGRGFARARAREVLLRQRLQEAGVYEEAKHPRGRGGHWIDVLGKLKALPMNKPQEVHGVPAMRLSTGHYAAAVQGTMIHDADPEKVAHAIGTHVARKQVEPYFDLSKPHEMVPVHSLQPTKTNPESSIANAQKRMGEAARGDLGKRKPVTAQRGAGGRLLLVDGHATHQAAIREGITHLPVEIRPRATPLDPKAKHEDVREQERLEKAAIRVAAEQRRPQRAIVQQMEAGRKAQAEREEILRKSPSAQAELERHREIARGASSSRERAIAQREAERAQGARTPRARVRG